jgi:dUTPase
MPDIKDSPEPGGFANSAIFQMFDIQNELNTKSYSDKWLAKGKSQEFDYEVAAAQEIGEFLNSVPYSWWTKAAPDRQNCVTELVDAWHFIMSQAILDHDDVKLAAAHAVSSYGSSHHSTLQATPIIAAKELVYSLYANQLKFQLAGETIYGDRSVDYLTAFFRLCRSYEVSMSLLYTRYVGKAELNKFRVENGYKVGQYKKIWYVDGKEGEDNFFLSTMIDHRIATGQEVDVKVVREFLENTYTAVRGSAERIAS